MKPDEILSIALQADCLHVNLTGDQAKGLERLDLFTHLVIENFLTRSGQYLTNDVTREAAIAEAVAVEREACAQLMATMREKSRNHLFRSALTCAEGAIRAREKAQ